MGDVREKWLSVLSDLNGCSQKGLVERFDGSIGAGSVFMPYGGKYQLTETQSMVAKLPVLSGHTDTVTMMSYGFDPYPVSYTHLDVYKRQNQNGWDPCRRSAPPEERGG